MYEIPKPELLNPDRIDRDDREHVTASDHRTQARVLAKALGESCAYADQLWEQVNALRGYLLDSLPPDPRTPGPHITAAASPTGPEDENGWLNWINAFATTTSVLCGSHGDSGFGLSRAHEEARLRRTAPERTVHLHNPDLEHPDADTPADDADTPAPLAAAPDPGPAPTQSGFPRSRSSAPAVKTAVGAAVAVLAVRGLRTLPGALPSYIRKTQ